MLNWLRKWLFGIIRQFTHGINIYIHSIVALRESMPSKWFFPVWHKESSYTPYCHKPLSTNIKNSIDDIFDSGLAQDFARKSGANRAEREEKPTAYTSLLQVNTLVGQG